MALSRTPHVLLDIATPTLTAILWLGGFPSIETAGLGLLTAFSGYNAVYALNDIKDYNVDREKMTLLPLESQGSDLDSVFLRHPVAQGKLGYWEGVFWMGAWAGLALLGSYLLNPVCTFIFLAT